MAEPDVKGDGSKGTAGPWLAEINRSRASRRQYLDRCKKIGKLYTNERARQESASRRFSLLWSNIQTLMPAVYARVPKGVVTRRFKDADPVGRISSEVLERAINYTLDADEFDVMMRRVRDDYLLYAMSTAWVRYEPETEMLTEEVGIYNEPLQAMETGEPSEQRYIREDNNEPVGEEPIMRTEDGSAYISSEYEAIKAEHVRFDFVHRDDFFHSPARTWTEVWWVARAAYLTRQELIDRFGEEKGLMVALDHKPGEVEKGLEEGDGAKATVYEIWSKRDRKVFFVAEGARDVLDEQEPFLTLSTFWPCPKPVFGTITSDSLVPTPDYILYQDQAETINDLIARIEEIQTQIKLAGFFPAGPSGDGSAAVAKAFTDNDTGVKLIPIPGWQSFMEKGGANSIVWVPIDQAANALAILEQELEREISRVYQITGISDIVRGDSDPNETATAQGIKAQWGSLRIRDRQMELARFARDIIQIIGEIIGEKFQPETLAQMTGIPLDGNQQIAMAAAQGDQQAAQQMQQMEQVIELLRNEVTRGFRIEIESDSTIQPDEQEEKQSRIEFLSAMGDFMERAQAAMAQPGGMVLAPLLGKMLTFGVRGFRVGRELEESIEQTMGQIEQMASQPQQQGPSPEEQAAQAKAEADTQQAQMKTQATQAQTQAKVITARADIAKTEADTRAHLIKNQSDIEAEQARAAMDIANGETRTVQ